MSLSSRVYLGLLVTIGLIIALITVSRGVVPQALTATDTAISYDAGWRAYCGLRPHADFYSSLGPFLYLYVGTAFWLFGPGVHSIAYINALSFCILLGLTWYLLRDRVSPFWLFLLSFLVAVTFTAPYGIRCVKTFSTYAGLYNRQAYSLAILFCALLLSPYASISDRRWKVTSAIVGLLLSTLFFHKITYFMAVVPIFAVAWYCADVRKWISLPWFAVGFAPATVFFLAYIRFDIIAMLSDLAITAKAKSTYFEAMREPFIFTLNDMINWSLICLFIFTFGIISLFRKKELNFSRKQAISEGAIFVAVIGASIFMILNNALWGVIEDYPVHLFLAALICMRVTSIAGPEVVWRDRSLSFKLMSGAAVLFASLNVAISTWYMVGYETRPLRAAECETETMKGMIFNKDFGSHRMFETTDSAVKLMTKHGIVDKPFAVMEFTSFVHYALRARPVGGSPFIDESVNISLVSYPSPEKYIGNAEYVLQSKGAMTHHTIKTLKLVYGDYLQQHYKVIDESDHWILMQRQ